MGVPGAIPAPRLQLQWVECGVCEEMEPGQETLQRPCNLGAGTLQKLRLQWVGRGVCEGVEPGQDTLQRSEQVCTVECEHAATPAAVEAERGVRAGW